jgi:hypothetical protein
MSAILAMDSQVGINSFNEINGVNSINGLNGINGIDGVNDVNSISEVHSGQQPRKRVVVVGLGMVGIAFM